MDLDDTCQAGAISNTPACAEGLKHASAANVGWSVTPSGSPAVTAVIEVVPRVAEIVAIPL
jgi:hypothetical protein